MFIICESYTKDHGYTEREKAFSVRVSSWTAWTLHFILTVMLQRENEASGRLDWNAFLHFKKDVTLSFFIILDLK